MDADSLKKPLKLIQGNELKIPNHDFLKADMAALKSYLEPHSMKWIWTGNPWKGVKVTDSEAMKVNDPESIKQTVRAMIYRANLRAGRAHG